MRFQSAINDSRCPRPRQPNSPLAPPRLSGNSTTNSEVAGSRETRKLRCSARLALPMFLRGYTPEESARRGIDASALQEESQAQG
jgi:hypothetical protein